MDGAARVVVCAHCSSNIYLPDDLWFRLHTVSTRRRWFLVWHASERVADPRRTPTREEERAAAEEPAPGSLARPAPRPTARRIPPLPAPLDDAADEPIPDRPARPRAPLSDPPGDPTMALWTVVGGLKLLMVLGVVVYILVA